MLKVLFRVFVLSVAPNGGDGKEIRKACVEGRKDVIHNARIGRVGTQDFLACRLMEVENHLRTF